MLDGLLDPGQEDRLNKFGSTIHDLFRVNSGYDNIGWAMCSLIVDRFGEERLQVIADSPVAFMRAYQDAAKSGAGTGDLAELPPYPDMMFAGIIDIMEKH